MYLLIQLRQEVEETDRENLHPTMYLLILKAAVEEIYTGGHLHPTMYLLIRTFQKMCAHIMCIYIPLCIY